VSIGMSEGPDEYLLGNPWGIAVGAGGMVYVLDVQVPVVRAYRSDGSHLRNVGREGSGPGEYRYPDGIATLRDGRLTVRDPGNARITVFDSAGVYLEQWWMPGGSSTSRRPYVDTAGNYYTPVWWLSAPSGEQSTGLARLSPDGEIVDTLLTPTWDFVAAEVQAFGEGLGLTTARVPFTPQPLWTFSPLGYLVGGLSTDYRIDLYRVESPLLRIERDWIPVRVADEEAREQVLRRTAQFRRRYGSWDWNGPSIPSTKPPFRDVFASREGNIWVLVSQEGAARMTEEEAREEERRRGIPPLRFTEPAAFDVFAPDGRLLGHVTAPLSFSTRPEPIVRGDTVWAVARDELDVAKLVRYKVVRSGAR